MIINLIRRIRRNHSIEHATITLLGHQYPQAAVFGLSGPFGFTLYTSLSAEEVIPIVQEAIKQLKAGRESLRIHPNCGTNLVTTATLTTLAALLGLKDYGKAKLGARIESFINAVALSAVALVASRPLGRWIQTHVTTESNLEGAEVMAIFTDKHIGYQRLRVHMQHTAL
ncbi:MAG: hypothetical protein JW981_11020 [Anaerolineae bacterium]|nr:hypothetical protein [Anaerolineae bacterium]